jgi:superfamily II DNA or RNA helicase|tara:strand:- start:618 stop:2054 length:1437 start_codon:yes stop_codon:yes gene_type:complete
MLTFDYNPSNRKIQIRTEDSSLFDKIREHFSVENEGARFARYRGRFAARRKYAITGTGNCEPGLYWDIRQYLIQEQIKVDIEITDKLKKILNVGKDVELYKEFTLELREYQEEVIRKALKIGRGTCVLGTGAGKTLTTAALIENYFQNCSDKDTFKCIVLVPDLGLVSQTYEEFNNVGTTFKMTKWTGKTKPDLTSNVVICNIGIVQSQFDTNDWMKYVDLLIVDECHKIKATNKVSKIVSNIRTHNKYGFTGTLPENNLDKWSIIGKLGPVIYEKTSYELRLEDYLANVNVKILNLDYNTPPRYLSDNAYKEELDFIYESHFRNTFLTKLCDKLENNTLILVNHISQGVILSEYLTQCKDKQVYFIRGEVEVDTREDIKRIMEKDNNVLCVAMSSIFSTGVNIKNLHNIIFAAGGKSFIRTVQSVGRGLRKHSSKNKLIIFDICDNLRYGLRHCEKRKEIYDREKIKYTESKILEKI